MSPLKVLRVPLCVLVAMPLLLQGCKTPVPAALERHMLSVDPSGRSYSDPSEDERPVHYLPGAESKRSSCESKGLEKQVRAVMGGFESHLDAGGAPEVVLFLHGGLVSMPSAFNEAERAIKLLPEEDFYPVFVSWNTGIGASYIDYLLRVRGGENVKVGTGIATAPLLITADVVRAVGRAPLNVWKQAAALTSRDTQRVPDGWHDSAALHDEFTDRTLWDWAREFFPGVARLVTTPVLDAIGDSAYRNMLRRTRVLFHLDGDYGAKRLECGVLSQLMEEIRMLELSRMGRALEERKEEEGDSNRNRGLDPVTRLRSLQVERRALRDDAGSDRVAWQANQVEIAGAKAALDRSTDCKALPGGAQSQSGECVIRMKIIAHSMGAIVANELLYRNSDLYFSDVVYMAAASSIKDFSELALPYLKANPTTHFYNLTLHPVAERREWSGYSMIPRGSLLDWLDFYMSEPKSPLDRTLGSWNNIAHALPLIDYLEGEERARFIVRGFGMTPDEPRRHSDFNDPPTPRNPGDSDAYAGAYFWRRAFWEGRIESGVQDP